jgi:hypothetical protein
MIVMGKVSIAPIMNMSLLLMIQRIIDNIPWATNIATDVPVLRLLHHATHN